MTRLADDVRPSNSELATFLEREIEPYGGEELERAQNAIRAVLKSGLTADGSAGTAALPAYYRDCIHAAVERRPSPALPPGLTRPSLQSFPVLAFLHPTAGLARTPWEWVSMFEQEIAAAISAAVQAEGDQADPHARQRLTALAMYEGQALYREGWSSGAFQYRSPAEIHDWFWPRLVERLRSPEYPPPPPAHREAPRTRSRRASPQLEHELPHESPPADAMLLASEDRRERAVAAFRRRLRLGALLTPAEREFDSECIRQLGVDRGLSGEAEVRAARQAAAAVLGITPANARKLWSRILAKARKVEPPPG